jgi:rubrerythrin
MSVLFTGKEIIDMAVQMEKNGEAFYTELAGRAENDAIKERAKYLAEQEVEHAATFKVMLEGLSDTGAPPESYPGEYLAYVDALVTTRAFTDEDKARAAAAGVKSDLEAINMALGAEKDTIIFYYEMLRFVGDKGRDVVNKIIIEEQSHVKMLVELKSQIN